MRRDDGAMKERDLLRIFGDAVVALDPAARVEGALPAAAALKGRPAYVIAIGKAAPAMAAGAIAAWGDAIERCLVVAPDDTDVRVVARAAKRRGLARGLVVMRAAHPVPDARSVRAAEACLGAAAAASGTVLVLVSGGASSLVCAPSRGVTLANKRGITRMMLESGASVQEINVVRRHLSRIKGGGLARAAGPNRVLTLVVSDVIGGGASDVGSGPSTPDATTVREARRILRRFAGSYAEVPLSETHAALANATRAKIIVSPEELARGVGERLRAQGVSVRILPPSQASIEELAAEYLTLARSRTPRAFVRTAEPSVEVPPGGRKGRGGRSTHLAALVGRSLGALDEAHRGRILFASLASDGIDGQSGTGGAIVDGSFVVRAQEALGKTGLDLAIARFDTGPLHRVIGTAVPARPTGHNLADLHVLVVA